jgi:hypothetical protein
LRIEDLGKAYNIAL